ncbi:MAG TPA: hypothetical protein VIG57_05680 [Candidatus Entotheonella sp.]|jgi:hypothetical protein
MYAVEFQAQIKNGTIEIPEAYRSRFKEHVQQSIESFYAQYRVVKLHTAHLLKASALRV